MGRTFNEHKEYGMAGKYECSIGKDGKHRFNLKAGNGQVILTSQGYNDKAGCMNGIDSVRKHGLKDAMFEKKSSSDGKLYFMLKAANGQVIGTSQRYASEASRNNGIDSVKRHAADAKHVEA
jgi:uncharacterized protein YegP (UPF0339 family)